tara:strand:- start:17443 stop:20181 length:2739 start_codon:yes stop_codon:yes gene_type:complete
MNGIKYLIKLLILKKKNKNMNSDSLATKEDLLVLIEEQKRIIEALQNNDERNSNLFNNSIDGFYKSTPEGEFIDVNPALVKMLGYNSKKELLAIDIKKDLYFDIKNRDLENLDEYNKDGRPMVPLRKKDGSAVWVEDSGKSIMDSEGNVKFHEGILRDVSERKKASQIQKILLKIAQEGYRSHELKSFIKFIMSELGYLIDTTNFYVAFYNEEKQTINIPFISGEVADTEFPIAKSMTGYLIKKNTPFYLKSKDYKKLIDLGKIELIGKFPAVWIGVPLRVDGKVIGAIVIQNYDDAEAYKQEDIELLEFVSSHISLAIQKKKNEDELAMSKEVLRNVFDNIPIRVYWKDKESRFLGCNKYFYEALAFNSDKEVIGKTDYDFNSKKIADITRSDELEIMDTGIPKLKFRETFIDNGKQLIFSTNKLPFFDENKNVIGIIGTSEDITERIQNEKKLENATEEAIAANLSKSVFLSNMSHEIRTPMNAILGYSQLLQDDDNLTKIQHENLNIINRSGEHLLALINDILDMSKIEAGRITLKLVDFSMVELLKEVAQLFKFKSTQKNLELVFKNANELPKTINADESKIRQVIINLIGNAIKFTSEGFVHVSVELLNNNFIQVSVKDSGTGILKEEQETIFKPFEQAQKGERIISGTGLGLAISKKFSNLMGGDITIESEYNIGSEFVFKFKFTESKVDALIEAKNNLNVVSLVPEMKGFKVAIVDDRFENRDILFKKLNPLGFEIRMAENGLEAVELYKEWKPDIVLMDVVMPVMDGVEATKQILELAGDHDVKIFVVSASALESEQKEVMEIGATVFIKKPVIFNLLLSEMHHKGGVKFIYKDEVIEEILNSKPSEVPSHLKDKLLIAASEGDFSLLQDLLELLEKETKKSFKYLEDCINEMEFENLITWLNS